METVSIVKVDSYQDNLIEKIEKLLGPLGGLAAFCKSGDRVLLKPNLLMPKAVESGVTTNPAVIMALVGLLKDIGCHIGIGDSPGIGSAEGVIRRLGIYEQLVKNGVKIVEFDRNVSWKQFNKAPVFERRYRNLELAGEILDYDKVINLPKLKSHGQMGLSLATKNLFGCLVGHNKGRWHFVAGRDLNAFARILIEIALTVNPTLHILDGIIGMDGNGPSNGRLRDLKVLVAGTNPLALDRVVAELIQKNPDQFPIFAAAQSLNLDGLEMNSILLKGGTLADFKINEFQIPARGQLDRFKNKFFTEAYKWLLRQNLSINHQVCISCLKCREHCPAGAITHRKRVVIKKSKCIKCCCCQEFCPAGAITLQDSWTARILGRVTKRL